MTHVLHALSVAVILVVLYFAVGKPLIRRGWFDPNQPDPAESEVVPQRLRTAPSAGLTAADGEVAAAWPQLPEPPPGAEFDVAAEARAICAEAVRDA